MLSSDRQRELYDLQLDRRLGRVMAPNAATCVPSVVPLNQLCSPNSVSQVSGAMLYKRDGVLVLMRTCSEHVRLSAGQHQAG